MYLICMLLIGLVAVAITSNEKSLSSEQEELIPVRVKEQSFNRFS